MQIQRDFMMFLAGLILLVDQVAGHARLLGAGPARCKQRPRNPRDRRKIGKISGTDGGPDCTQCIRCVSQFMADAKDKVNHWCENTGNYNGATVDDGYCLGAEKNTQVPAGNDPGELQMWGKDSNCEWKEGDIIDVAIQVHANHKGTFFLDMVPTSEEQLKGLDWCPGVNDKPFSNTRLPDGDFKPCKFDNVNQSPDAKPWQNVSIKLHPAFPIDGDTTEASKDSRYNLKYYEATSDKEVQEGQSGNYRVYYSFKLPKLPYDPGERTTVRFVWFCGYDVETNCWPEGKWLPHTNPNSKCPSPNYVHGGMGEIFINCVDLKGIIGNHSPSPPTSAPVPPPVTPTQAPAPTPAPTQAPTQVPTQAPAPPTGRCKFKGSFPGNKNVGSETSGPFADWCSWVCMGEINGCVWKISALHAVYHCCHLNGPDPISTTTPAPISTTQQNTTPSTSGFCDSCDANSGDCVAIFPNSRGQWIKDVHCRGCGIGSSKRWWPCNVKGLCQCKKRTLLV